MLLFYFHSVAFEVPKREMQTWLKTPKEVKLKLKNLETHTTA